MYPNHAVLTSVPSISWDSDWEVDTAAFARLNEPVRRASQPQDSRLNEYNCPLLGPASPKPRHLDPDLLAPYTESFTAALKNALAGDDNPYGEFDNVTNSFSIALWSTASNSSLFEYHFEGPGLGRDSETLNNETIYRVGSISKVYTVYAYLATIGEAHLDQPITKFIPELAQIDAESAQDPKSNDIDTVRWSEVTPRSIAAQLGGLPRDYGLGDVNSFGLEDEELSMFGLPPLETTTKPFCVPFTAGQNTECSREEFFEGIRGWHPVSTPYTTPNYGNPNFGLLAWALEAIVDDGRNFTQILQDSVISPLDLRRTFLQITPESNVTNAMIPFNATAADWFLTGSFDDPAGNYYSSVADLNALGRSILRSSLVPRQLTNRWLKPVTQTAETHQAVGMPFEIYRFEVPVSSGSSATRLVEVYTKAGDVGLYASMWVMVPDYDIGFTVLVAGAPQGSLVRVYLTEMMRDYFLPAMEELAAKEAESRFGGTYVDASTNSSVTVALRADRVGLGLENWVSRGIDMQSADDMGLKALYGYTGNGSMELRLQPMGLTDEEGGRVGFRVVAKTDDLPRDMLWSCFSWASVDAFTYGGVGLDELVFELDGEGAAAALDLRGFRTVLERSSSG